MNHTISLQTKFFTIRILKSHTASEMHKNLYATDKFAEFYSDMATNFNSDTTNFKPQFYD